VIVYLVLNVRKDLVEKVDEGLREKWGDSGVDDVYILRKLGDPALLWHVQPQEHFWSG